MIALDKQYGKSIKPKELAKFLNIDPRTVIKYADKWGGVEVSPGRYRFFEMKIKEVLDAEFDNKKREKKMAWERFHKREATSEIVPGRLEKVLQSSIVMGKRDKKEVKRGTSREDPHGLL